MRMIVRGVLVGLMAATVLSIGAAADSESGIVSDGLSQKLIQDRYGTISESLCLLSYSLEITNPNSGRTNKRDSNAIGIVVSDDGLVMAHGHLQLENRQPLNVRVTINLLGERKEYPATLLKRPDDVNVCFLRIEFGQDPVPPLTPMPFVDSGDLGMGEPLLVMGILAETLDHVPTTMGRRVGAILEEPRITYALNESVPFGFVGGPVLNTNGETVGVVGFDLSANEGGDVYTRSGHPLVFQTALFDRYIKTPPSAESLETDQDDAWLGVLTQPLTDDLAEYWELPTRGGIVVSTVVPGSPAEAAGLRMGDVIVGFGDEIVDAKQDRDVAAFTRMVRATPLGDEIPIRLYRDGEATQIALTLTDRPIAARDAREHEDQVFGVTVRDLTTDVRIMVNLPDDVTGVIVRKVESGSAANLAGIPPNAIILALNGQPVPNIERFIEVVNALQTQEPNEIAVLCRVGPRTGFFRMQPRW